MEPLILVTNDDGILSPGLIAAAEAVQGLGDLLIAAPRTQQTAMGRAFPRAENVGLIEEFELLVNHRRVTGYGITGSPAQVVSHALLELAPRKPALCISGVNYGENIGRGLMASGTLGAAFEADGYGIPAIAVSQELDLELQQTATYGEVDWRAATHFTGRFAEKIIREGLPGRVALLNLNIPVHATPETPVRLTTQSSQSYYVFRLPEKRDFSKAFRLKLELFVDQEKLEETSDIKAIRYDRVVSLTPLTWDLSAATEQDLAGWV